LLGNVRPVCCGVDDEDIAIALEFRNLIVELERIAREVFRQDAADSMKEKLIAIHERLRSDLESLIEHGRADMAKVERAVARLPQEHEARRHFEELSSSLERAREELERENYTECMSEILVFLDSLRALERAFGVK